MEKDQYSTIHYSKIMHREFSAVLLPSVLMLEPNDNSLLSSLRSGIFIFPACLLEINKSSPHFREFLKLSWIYRRKTEVSKETIIY